MSQNQPAVFQYHNSEVRVVKDDKGEPWWVAKDVCDVLGISNARDAMTRIDDDEKSTVGISDGGPEVNIINESGLYSLILRSNKPEAKEFKRWVTHEVLPSIRKTGTYVAPRSPIFDLAYEVKKWALAQTIPFTARNVNNALGVQGVNQRIYTRDILRRLRDDGVLEQPLPYQYRVPTGPALKAPEQTPVKALTPPASASPWEVPQGAILIYPGSLSADAKTLLQDILAGKYTPELLNLFSTVAEIMTSDDALARSAVSNTIYMAKEKVIKAKHQEEELRQLKTDQEEIKRRIEALWKRIDLHKAQEVQG